MKGNVTRSKNGESVLLLALLVSSGTAGCRTITVDIEDRRGDGDHYAHELEYIVNRRRSATIRSDREQPPVTRDNLFGLAFSGGGIRSATFNLGVLQALESEDTLANADYLSAVSGGAYIASWYVAHLLPPDEEEEFDADGVLLKSSDPRRLLLEPADDSDAGWRNADAVEHLKGNAGFLLDDSPFSTMSLLGSWLVRWPINLGLDVIAHFKPARGKSNLHHPFILYRDRICETYLRGCVDQTLAEVNPNWSEAPYLIVNATLGNHGVFRAGEDFPHDEEAGVGYVNSPFEMTRDFCGAPGLGYVPTRAFEKPVTDVDFEDGFPSSVTVRTHGLLGEETFPISTAVAASGAALDSQVADGAWYSFPLDLILRFFNANTRYECENYAQSLAEWWWSPLDRVREVTADRFVPTVRSNSLNLSDGGHYDNLGVRALAVRGVRTIVVFDASADPRYTYGSLRQAQEAVRREGMEWTFDAPVVMNKPPVDPIARGTIRGRDGIETTIWYVKNTVPEGDDVPPFVRAYANGSDTFPHTPTSKQWYEWRRFEAYRQLGFVLGRRLAERLRAASGARLD